MRGLTAKSRIAIGQTGLLTSVVMMAILFGIVPDRTSAVREGRAALAESIAANSSVFISHADVKRLEANLRLVVERNEDLLSAGLRREDGVALATVGEHENQWQDMLGEFSTDAQVMVPIWAGETKWGQIELRFLSLSQSGMAGLVNNPTVRLVGFIALFSFFAFYFYLGKMLKHLDPSQAIPGRVRAALDTMAEGLLVLDRKEQVVLANQAFATLLGKSADDLLGFKAGDFPWTETDGAEIPADQRPWRQALDEGVAKRNSMVRLKLPGDKQRTFMTNCSPVLGSRGQSTGVLVSFDDVTELEQIEIELRKSRDEAEAANVAKSAFLANMSHEIRTPMNAILGFAEVLKRGYDKNSSNSRKHLDTILSSGTHLLELINDILDLSKVESGRLEVELQRVEPHKILKEVVKIFSAKANEKAVNLVFRADTPLPETIQTDPGRLRQIATNLVGNAIKFTDGGKITVSAQLEPSGSAPALLIKVTDTGIGMDADHLESIFDPFVQADASITRRFGGTGLGLSISRKFARALGGDITVESRAGEGSCFSVRIATGSLTGVRLLEPNELLEADSETESLSQVSWEFPPSRILVVDDGSENRELVSVVLDEFGLRVDEAENGQICVAMVQEKSYDLILMDVQMPVMDGFTATRMLREQGVTTPIVALTANAMKGFEQKCLAGGYSGYLTKPIDIDVFVRRLAEILGGRPIHVSPAAAAQPDSAPEADLISTPELSGPPITSRLPQNNAKFSSIIRRFVAHLDSKLAAMDKAFEQGDMQQMAALAHWLKGSGGTAGFDEFTEPARLLETSAKQKDISQVKTIIWQLRDLTARLVVPGDFAKAAASVSRIEPKKGMDGIPGDGIKFVATPSHILQTGPIVSRLARNPRLHNAINTFVARLRDKVVQMEDASSNQDYKALALLAHWLKGAGGTVGFDQFTEPAEELEQFARSNDPTGAATLVGKLKAMAERVQQPAPAINQRSVNSLDDTTVPLT